MKVIDVLELMNEYDKVRILGATDIQWDNDNPHLLEPTKVRDLGWLFVQKVSSRNVVELTTDAEANGGDFGSFLSIVYR